MTPEEQRAKDREYERAWRSRNKDKVRAKKKRYDTAHPDRKAVRSTRSEKKGAAELTDRYVRKSLAKTSEGLLKPSDFPQELVEVQRAFLAMVRLLRSEGVWIRKYIPDRTGAKK